MPVYLAEDELDRECLVIEFEKGKKGDRTIAFVRHDELDMVRFSTHCSFVAHQYHPTLWLSKEDLKKLAELAAELAEK